MTGETGDIKEIRTGDHIKTSSKAEMYEVFMILGYLGADIPNELNLKYGHEYILLKSDGGHMAIVTKEVVDAWKAHHTRTGGRGGRKWTMEQLRRLYRNKKPMIDFVQSFHDSVMEAGGNPLAFNMEQIWSLAETLGPNGVRFHVENKEGR